MKRTFFVNEEVVPNVTLNEVRPFEVVLNNKRNGQLQVLAMEEKVFIRQPGRRTRANARRASSGSPNQVVLNKQEFIRDLQQNYAELISTVKPQYVRDSKGDITGITAKDISKIPLARKLNLQDNDILQTINNVKIDSEEKIIEVIERYRDASTFRLGILRNGRPRILTYRFR